MKKIIKTLLVVTLVVLAVLALASCQEDPCKDGHTMEAIAEKLATCTENGWSAGVVCKVCGYEERRSFVLEAKGHKWVDADCETPKTCSVCDATEGEALGHSFTDLVPAKAPTCEAKGYTEHRECYVCGKPNEEYAVVEATGHTWANVEAKDPTCTEAGYTAHKACETCGATDGKQVVPTAHKVGEDGVCTGCGYVIVDTAEELIAAIAVSNNKVIVLAGTYAVVTNADKGTFGLAAGVELVGQGEVVIEGTLSGTLENLTLKNIHIKSGNAQRWAYAKGTLVFENVTFEATSVYALHFDGITAGTTVLYKDCTIIGWAAMSGSPESVTFDGCTVKGNGTYGAIRTYFDATIKNCTFDVANVNTEDVYQDGIHAVNDAVVTVENCTNLNGEMKDIIETSGNSYVVLDGESIHTHKFVDVAGKDATCTEAGYTAHKACACGETEGKETVAASEHAWNEGEVTTAPTCTVAGVKTFTCTFEGCGETKTEAVEATGEHADANGDYKCDGCATAMLPADGEALTVAQALAIAKLMGDDSYTTQKYYITGEIVSVGNTTYGNLTIKDATGELYIYGVWAWNSACTGSDGRYDSFSYKPVTGDEITIYGVIGNYKSDPQMKNTWLDEVVAHEHDYTSVVTDPTCTKGGYTTHTCTICNAYVVDTEVEALGHTTTNGTCERCEQVIGSGAPSYDTFTADFSSLNKNTTYGTYTTTDKMWTAKNAQVLQGGTADNSNNGTYTVIGGAAARAIVLNGKTSAKGVLTSATISGGISNLTFKYTNFYAESNGVDITVTIKQNGTVVASKKLDNNSVTKLASYTFEWDLASEGVAVTGDFVIEITNNSPSDNTGNKDRVGIWNIEWTNNPEA